MKQNYEQRIKDILKTKENKEGLATYKISVGLSLSPTLCKTILEDMAKRKIITKIATPVRTTYWRIR